MNQPVEKDHRRELYSPASTAARQLSDATGPDNVRVSVRVEPAVDRLLRWRFKLFTPRVLTDPVDTYVEYRMLPGLVQKYLLRGRWAVEVEADSGEHVRVRADTRDAAVNYAQQIHDGVLEQGVAFLRTFAN